MANRTFYFLGLQLDKDKFLEDDNLMTSRFWENLISQFIAETTDETAKKYAIMARDYIVYYNHSSDYNPVSQKAYASIEFMAERHVPQYKTLISAILEWANAKYGMVIVDEIQDSILEDHQDYVDIVRTGFLMHIPDQLGYIV